jgi:hypothetical protein
MKMEWRTALGAATVLAVIGAVYWVWSSEDAGTVMLSFGGAAYLLMAAWIMLQWLRRKRTPRPEDDARAEVEDGAGEVAFFPAASIWPAGIGVGAIFLGVTLVFGNWYWLIALPLVVGAIIGYMVEAESKIPE